MFSMIFQREGNRVREQGKEEQADLDQILDVRFVIWEGRSLNVRVQDHGRRAHVSSHGVHDDVHAFGNSSVKADQELQSDT